LQNSQGQEGTRHSRLECFCHKKMGAGSNLSLRLSLFSSIKNAFVFCLWVDFKLHGWVRVGGNKRRNHLGHFCDRTSDKDEAHAVTFFLFQFIGLLADYKKPQERRPDQLIHDNNRGIHIYLQKHTRTDMANSFASY